jgi:AraC family transcriptional regulator of adaptative response/methylated-DNA-[protein]-cysteine methyltransferase
MQCWRAMLRATAALFSRCARPEFIAAHHVPARRPHREQVRFFKLPEAAEQAGFRACKRCHPRRAHGTDPQVELVRRVCHLIDEHDNDSVTLDNLSSIVGVNAHHLQRTFKQIMGITPRQYADSRKLNRFKSGVKKGASVTEAMYDAGYGSSRALYEKSAAHLGMTPATYGRGGKGMRIAFTIADSPLGRLLVAATERGVCSVTLGDSDAELARALFAEYPEASIDSKDTSISPSLNLWLDCVLDSLKSSPRRVELPMDVQATAFQWRVWEELRRIPFGSTRFVSGNRQSDRQAKRRARSSPRMREQSPGARDSVPSSDSRRQKFGRLSLGTGTERKVTAARRTSGSNLSARV